MDLDAQRAERVADAKRRQAERIAREAADAAAHPPKLLVANEKGEVANSAPAPKFAISERDLALVRECEGDPVRHKKVVDAFARRYRMMPEQVIEAIAAL